MKFTNLRLVGFKSFVETTDFEIREGLTGIVGPNGCGKSNLLEALRWVMGATSAKALRGGGMGDVIFAGTSMRPARNWAEVVLTLDNSDRTAPAEFNEASVIEVSRRILHKEEGTQSIYRINSKEVRAKDVQLLFADASSGANSPSLVRQGQVAELINAKPENRRRLLEEAAGITGLHTRRHEAELRLRAAETNLERLEDVTGELETQRSTLARQARQATRYKNISGDIRRAEAMAAYLRWSEAVEAQKQADAHLAEVSELIEETARAAALAATAQGEIHATLEPLRLTEAEAAAGLHRLTVAREGLDEEAKRARSELERLIAEIARFEADGERESGLLDDAQEAIEALSREEEGLKSRENSEAQRLEAAAAEMAEQADSLTEREKALESLNAEAAESDAKRRSVSASLHEANGRLSKLRSKIEGLEKERANIAPSAEQAQAMEDAKARARDGAQALADAEAAHQQSEEMRAAAQEQEQALRGPHQKAEQRRSELHAECEALKRVLAASNSGDWEALIEAVTVEPGYENALAAALGDDLDVAITDEAPIAWSAIGGTPSDATSINLPAGAAPLSDFVKAPTQLARRLAAIGVVDRDAGEALQAALPAGARLVTKEGDLWRWDGFTARAEAKTAAAIRLEQRNRLTALITDLEGAQERANAALIAHKAAQEDVTRQQANEKQARTLLADARKFLDRANSETTSLERAHERASARINAIDEAIAGLREDETEAAEKKAHAEAAQADLPDTAIIAKAVADAKEATAAARASANEARAAHNDLKREAQMRAERIQELARERGVWKTRGETAKTRLSELEERLAASRAAKLAADGAPDAIEEKRRALLDKIAEAEKTRNDAADALAEATQKSIDADRSAKSADTAAGEAREARARAEAQAESAGERVAETASLAQETCSAPPERLLAIAEHKEETELPARDDIERKLERYKRERERLGGVNLRAEEEMSEISERLDEIATEREDCEAAIRKLRAAIGGINKEARQRLNSAFDTVNKNFSTLFTRLFNGGQAELRMIESEDVLEAGLEIFASPPGKKLTSMSLMSGGEQALTATALIFAVFMANPAPVCVLDEVDAPLDDTNTERFCRMLQSMAEETATRFIIITHHALTMSRMNRLFGVTMIERGVSQLVSVDLQRAEQLAAE